MIYTVTLDPMLDRVVRIEELIYDDANHITEDHRRPSGKGINVSRLIKELGGESISLGFAGGYTGLELTDLLAAEGLQPDFTRIKNETRASLTIFQRKVGVSGGGGAEVGYFTLNPDQRELRLQKSHNFPG